MAEKVKLPEVTILGRIVQFKQFNDTQIVLIHRMRQMLNGALAAMPALDTDEDVELTETEQRALYSGMDVMARFLDMLGYMVVDDDSREWLAQQMLAGNIGLDEIAKFVPQLVSDDKKDKTPAKKAVRAR